MLYGVWTPIGITYKDIGDAYAVTSFSGDIKNLVIPETYNGKPVKEISSNAFISERGRELVSVTLPAGVSIIGEGAFRECSHLEEILINGKSDYFLSEQGVLYSVNKTLKNEISGFTARHFNEFIYSLSPCLSLFKYVCKNPL